VEVVAPAGGGARLEGLPGLWLLHLEAGRAGSPREVLLRLRPDVRATTCSVHRALLVVEPPPQSVRAPAAHP
jgi:hypothetical protein